MGVESRMAYARAGIAADDFKLGTMLFVRSNDQTPGSGLFLSMVTVSCGSTL